jgi:hypothetical protein
MFFAFSTEQFNESKTPIKEGEKYLSLGAGAYMPESSAKRWISGSKEINNWYKSEVKKLKEG